MGNEKPYVLYYMALRYLLMSKMEISQKLLLSQTSIRSSNYNIKTILPLVMKVIPLAFAKSLDRK